MSFFLILNVLQRAYTVQHLRIHNTDKFKKIACHTDVVMMTVITSIYTGIVLST